MNFPFEPPTGLDSDDTVYTAPGKWRDASMVRFWRDSWQALGGWERLTFNTIGGVCRSVFGWTDFSSGTPAGSVAFGTHQSLELWQAGGYYSLTPTIGFTAGQKDGTGGAGFSTGGFGVGLFGEPSTSDYFPLTWSLCTYGNELIANPRGQGIFIWANNTASPAALLANAPAKVTCTVCPTTRQIMALGCNEEVSGVFNPLAIRFSDLEQPTVWTTTVTNNAGEYILPGSGEIVAGRLCGDHVLVWTTDALFLGTYIGSPTQTWAFEKVGDHCGSISPGAPIIRGQEAIWISPDHNFWSYVLGGVPQIVPCPIRDDFAENVAIGQSDKIVGASISSFGEAVWFYPDTRDGLEVSRELRVSPDGWIRGRLARTAFLDAGPHAYPIGVSYDPVAGTGAAYWHEKGHSADGGPITGWIEGTDFYIAEAQGGLMIGGVWPDFRDQIGALSLTLYLRDHPQATERVKGPWLLAPGLSKRSFRAAGRICRVRFDFSSGPFFARQGKLEFDVQAIGGR